VSSSLPLVLRVFLVSVILALTTACAGPKVTVYEESDGTIIVESLKMKATVTAIDGRARTVTLKRRFHKAQTFKADKSFTNFNQIQVGDEVHAVVVEQIAVTLVPGGAPPMVEESEAVSIAPDGDKPSLVLVDSVGLTAEVTAIDLHSHRVTLELPDGSLQNVKVAKHIDLTQVALGDSVFIEVTEGVAIEVVKPS
jgi:hypothetical protein